MRFPLAFALLVAASVTQGIKPAGYAATDSALTSLLDRRTEQYELRADDFLQALAKLAAQFRVPLGIEWVRSARTSSPVYLFRRNVTLREFIGALVDSEPGFEMKVEAGIVRVGPKGAERDKHDFLNMRVQRFQLTREYVMVGSRRLWGQIHWSLNPAEVPPVAEAGSIGIGNGDQKVSFQITNGTVRDVLDKLATSAGLNVWIVTYPEDPTYTAGGYRRTVSVFRDSIPDEEQPQWDLLLWGFDPVSKKVRREWLDSSPAPDQ